MSEIIPLLAKVSELWLDPHHPLHQVTVEALQVSTGFSRRQIEMALTNCFEELTQSKLESYVDNRHPLRSSAGDPSARIDPPSATAASADARRRCSGWAPASAGDDGKRSVYHVLPANAFTAWVHGAVITLLLGHRCLLKPSTREPIFARAWQKSLAAIDPSLAARVEIVSWDVKRVQECQGVIAYGSNETLETIRALLPKGMRFAGYGHKLSVAIIFEEALGPAASEVLLDDIRRAAGPFRMQGCLSPQILYVENEKRSRWPELEATLDAVPKIKSFAQWEEVSGELGKFTPYLSCVGYAGAPERETFLAEALRPYAVSRVCPVGLMQRPPLTWRNGGIDLSNLLN